MKLECPPTTQDETEQLLQNGHQWAEITNNASQGKATRTIHKFPNRAKTKQTSTKDHEGQPEPVARPKLSGKTEETPRAEKPRGDPAVHLDDTQKSTYTAKVDSTEATALFDSGASLSCI